MRYFCSFNVLAKTSKVQCGKSLYDFCIFALIQPHYLQLLLEVIQNAWEAKLDHYIIAQRQNGRTGMETFDGQGTIMQNYE